MRECPTHDPTSPKKIKFPSSSKMLVTKKLAACDDRLEMYTLLAPHSLAKAKPHACQEVMLCYTTVVSCKNTRHKAITRT